MSLEARMAQKTMVTSCGCHLWMGACFDSGYGAVQVSGRVRRAHRVAYELANGVELAQDQILLHSCDVKSCVNPEHLSVGTNLENNRDCINKGRYRNRYGAPKRVVDSELVAQIERALQAGERGCDIAARLGVNRPMVSRIKNGRRQV